MMRAACAEKAEGGVEHFMQRKADNKGGTD